MSQETKQKVQALLDKMTELASQTPDDDTVVSVEYHFSPAGCYCVIFGASSSHVLEPADNYV